MLGNNTMETTSKEVTSIRRRNNVEKSTWGTHRYFVDFESQIYVEISTSNRCQKFPLGFTFQNRCNFDELSTWNFDVESMVIRRGCVHWEYAGQKGGQLMSKMKKIVSNVLEYDIKLNVFYNLAKLSKFFNTKDPVPQKYKS